MTNEVSIAFKMFENNSVMCRKHWENQCEHLIKGSIAGKDAEVLASAIEDHVKCLGDLTQTLKDAHVTAGG